MTVSKAQQEGYPSDTCVGECIFATAMAHMPVGVVLTDAGGRTTWLNRAAAGLLGDDSEDGRGKPLEQIIRDAELAAFWYDYLDRGGHHMAVISANWPRELELRASATVCMSGQQEPMGHVLVLCDVTRETMTSVELSKAVATRLLALTAGHMPPEPVRNLTNQEIKILRLVGRGLGNEAIAHEANLATSTVRTHLKNLYRKLGLETRSEAVSFAIRHHLV